MTIVTDEMCDTFRQAWHAKLDGNPIREGLAAVLLPRIEWGVQATSTRDGDVVTEQLAFSSEEVAHGIVEAGPTGSVESLQLIHRVVLSVGGRDYFGEWEVVNDA